MGFFSYYEHDQFLRFLVPKQKTYVKEHRNIVYQQSTCNCERIQDICEYLKIFKKNPQKTQHLNFGRIPYCKYMHAIYEIIHSINQLNVLTIFIMTKHSQI